VISKTTAKFWHHYNSLPVVIKKRAKKIYLLFENNPWHPSISFKRVHSSMPIYPVRVSKDYRVVGVLKNQEILWFWIGTHSGYNNLLTQL